MSAESGGRRSESATERDWLLRCEGFRVDGPEGLVGYVVAAVYEHSARWDRPSGFTVRTARGLVTVPAARIDAVDRAERRLVLGDRV